MVKVNPAVSTATLCCKEIKYLHTKLNFHHDARKTNNRRQLNKSTKQLKQKDMQTYLWMTDISSLHMYCQVNTFPIVQLTTYVLSGEHVPHCSAHYICTVRRTCSSLFSSLRTYCQANMFPIVQYLCHFQIITDMPSL